MGPAIHINDAEGMGPADIKDIHFLEFRHVHEIDAIRRLKLTRDSGSVTSRMRLQLVNLAILIKRFRPRLERNRIHRSQSGTPAKFGAIEGQPQSLFFCGNPKIWRAVRKMRGWLRR